MRPIVAPLVLSLLLLLAACAGGPWAPFSTDTPPLALVPAAQAGVSDQRGRFREIYCQVLAARADQLSDHRPCDAALTRVGVEPAGSGQAVSLGAAQLRLMAMVVPGLGYDCVEPWLQPPGTGFAMLRQHGYEVSTLRVAALSSSAHNARQIRDAVMALPAQDGAPRVVLIGYSKGTPDILEALAAYPELRGRVAATVSVAGAVGGSPLAGTAEEYQADLLRHFPGAQCDVGDGGAVASLRPATRQAWLAANALPRGLRSYSVVTFPQPERISVILKSSYDKLARVDARNDGQLLFYDQVIPGSTLLAYINADHWAVALPIARTHTTLAATLVTENAYPREALLEAIVRFVDEDLRAAPR